MTDLNQTVSSLLRTAFPDPEVIITPEAVEASLRCLQDAAAKHPQLFQGHGIDSFHATDPAPPPRDPRADPRIVDYWVGTGTHHRTSPIESRFPVQLYFARVSVLDGWETSPIETPIGTMYAGDHKLYSMTLAREYLADMATTLNMKFPALDRVHVISPVRSGGSRFGAIGVYLFFAHHERIPFAYVLEAGMATGESRVLYFGPDFVNPILRRSHYHPTPFSEASFYYRGLVKLQGADPSTLTVEVLNDPKSEPHMRVDIAYSLVPEAFAVNVFPATLTLQAACRVAAIAEASGVPFPDLGPLTPLFAHLGREMYPWITKPGAKP